VIDYIGPLGRLSDQNPEEGEEAKVEG